MQFEGVTERDGREAVPLGTSSDLLAKLVGLVEHAAVANDKSIVVVDKFLKLRGARQRRVRSA